MPSQLAERDYVCSHPCLRWTAFADQTGPWTESGSTGCRLRRLCAVNIAEDSKITTSEAITLVPDSGFIKERNWEWELAAYMRVPTNEDLSYLGGYLRFYECGSPRKKSAAANLINRTVHSYNSTWDSKFLSANRSGLELKPSKGRFRRC